MKFSQNDFSFSETLIVTLGKLMQLFIKVWVSVLVHYCTKPSVFSQMFVKKHKFAHTNIIQLKTINNPFKGTLKALSDQV